MPLKEIKKPEPEDKRPIGELCPYCNVPTHYQHISCPDGRPGCGVMHFGYHCDNCGRDFYSEGDDLLVESRKS